MRINVRAIALSALILMGPVGAAVLDASYTPTRAEWLKQSVSAGIIEQSSAWKKRLAVLVVVFPDRNEVVVTLTEANGEVTPSKQQAQRYVDAVRAIAKSVLDRFEWAKGIKLTVQMA